MNASKNSEADSSFRSRELFDAALRVIPGGVNSPVRAFRGVGGTPRFIQSAQGCRLTDVDGNRYIDFIGSWGAMIAGHAEPSVTQAIERAARDGTSFGAPTPREVELALEIIKRIPSVEMVRMVNSGTEAVMSAIRLARAATGRDMIVKFSGGYHGHADSLLVQAGSGAATLGLPDSPGVPKETAALTLTAVYNDTSSIEQFFAAYGNRIAAILIEPIAGNMGVVPPAEGFLQAMRKITTLHSALLIFDEVMTGFRVHHGGAQALYGIEPDLTTLGKVIGGGLPVGAYGGRRVLMEQIAPAGPVYQAGTLSGNPLAMAAGIATLSILSDSAYARLEQISRQLHEGLERLLHDAHIRAVVQRVGSMLTVFFGVDHVRDYEEAKSADHKQFAAFFHGMLSRGVHLPPSGYEAWFISLAHDEAAIDETLQAAQETLREIG